MSEKSVQDTLQVLPEGVEPPNVKRVLLKCADGSWDGPHNVAGWQTREEEGLTFWVPVVEFYHCAFRGDWVPAV